ncbi:MAG: hypothetical protein A4E36_01957 [Methanoregulaceae archaeon PtaB.Bin009]|nr:MAG: hypothetical protein A4E36_01957 [Methanoregulaceae archaeon PtaB.Bin009]OPY37829.1 MAG: hypothetical protein A4E41_02148 [Methanoregulaceae archaeon PtaU1.Bin066]HNQ30651.1 hypothetical protein [Methanolinea sp.]
MTNKMGEPDSSSQAGNAAGTEEELFDLLIPPGVPRSIISDIIQKFDVELVERKQRLHFANMDGDEREILAFRGTRPVVEKVQDYMFSELQKFIERK